MKTFNLFNGSVVAGSGPNQTNETQSRHNRVGRITYLCRTFTVLLTFLILGVGQMWGYDGFSGDNNTFNNPYLYFYNSQGWNKAAVIFGRKYDKDNYTKVANMALVANTSQLYYVYVNDYWNTSYNEIAVMEVEKSGDSWGDAAQDIESRWGAVSHKTAIKWNYGFTDDYGTYYITSSGSDNIDISYKSNGYSDIPKCTTTLEVQTRNSTGLYTAINSDAPATLTIGGTYLSSMSSNQINSTTAYDANNWPTASTFNSVISGLAKVKYANMDDKYQFDGWYVSDSQEGTGTEYTFYQTTNTTVVAKFTRVKYTVTFDQQSGSEGSSSVTATYNSAMPSATMPTRSNYTFDGYYSGTSGTGTKYYNADGSSAKTCDLTGDITLYAKWTQTVTLNANTSHGGSGSDGNATAIWNGGTLTDISHPSGATGYTCTGYYTAATDGTKVLNADGTYAGEDITDYITSNKWSRTSSTTLYAQWDNHYTVTFDQGTPTFYGTGSATATYNSAMPAISVPGKTGYIFGGYYIDEECASTKYYNEDGTNAHVWDQAANTTLYAKWTGIDFSVAFDANGGTGSMSNQDFVYGTSEDLTANTFTRSGYRFLGWNTNADGSGTAYHDEKDGCQITSNEKDIITLYAQWAENHTLYFINAGCDWGTINAYAEITYDGVTSYPLGSSLGTTMDRVLGDITLTHIEFSGSHTFLLYKIDNVPEGAIIKFNDNSGNWTGDQTWTAEKPYFMYGNSTWFALDEGETNTITAATNMSVYVNGGYHAIEDDGTMEYAIVELNGSTNYHYKYWNWLSKSWSGCDSGDEKPYIMNEDTETGISPTWGLNGANGGKDVWFYAPATGEYKFQLTWAGGGSTPETTLYFPVGVTLGLSSSVALEGTPTTITLSATKQANYQVSSPTYYYQVCYDGSNWETIASGNFTSYAYSFDAKSCKFRVILQNDQGLKSKSSEQSFVAYTTKSFYVWSPYNNASDKWTTLHLYTWNGSTKYNGETLPGGASGSCINGNDIEANIKGSDWYKITINELADKFILVGDEEGGSYDGHKTQDCKVSDYIQGAKYMIVTIDGKNYVKEYTAKGNNDFRLKYTGGGKTRYSDIYNTILDGTTITTSMWMDASDETANLIIQQGSGNSLDPWSDIVSSRYSNSAVNGFNGIVPSDKRGRGYVFKMQLNINTENTASSTIDHVSEYTGPFYVRTDGLDGGWNKYKSASNQMHYSEISLTAGTPAYDYYVCKWIDKAGTNVKFTVANDYNSMLVENLEGDVNSTDPLYNTQNLLTETNVRFAWNSRTNTLTRAYLSGASSAASRFLVMVETTDPAGKIFDEYGRGITSGGGGKVAGLNDHELLFKDNGNWVYQLVLQAQPDAQAKVTAKYNGKEQTFIADKTVLGGNGSSTYTFRFVYDFKTNRLVSAFYPSGSINEELSIETDMMIIRTGQGEANQITFGKIGDTDDYGSLSEVKTVYGAMKFEKSTITNSGLSPYARDLYWISFPFNVQLSDVFGFGEYGTHWIIEYYDGIGRATNGFWADSPSNWKFVTPAMRDDYTLEANVGYILALDLDEMTESSSVWDNDVEDVYLYFPSSATINDIQSTNRLVTFDQTGYKCNIGPRFAGGDDRRVKDSYWHCIGVPSFANYSRTLYDENGGTAIDWSDADGVIDWETPNLPYLYEWVPASNTLNVIRSTPFSFKAMWSYLVQYSGDSIYWSAVNVTPASVAARLAETEDREYKLVLQSDERTEDQTFIRLTDDANVTPEFEFNYDLSKEMNKNRGNIYTLISSTIDSIPSIIEAAANVQPKPLQTTLVPVGVKVVANGEYTLAMPEGTNGEDVYLIDNAYGTRTNLGLMPYTVTLTAGTYDSRFALEFGPIQDAPTGIEQMSTVNYQLSTEEVRKVFVGGRLYIIRDGKVYDAAGQRIE